VGVKGQLLVSVVVVARPVRDNPVPRGASGLDAVASNEFLGIDVAKSALHVLIPSVEGIAR